MDGQPELGGCCEGSAATAEDFRWRRATHADERTHDWHSGPSARRTDTPQEVTNVLDKNSGRCGGIDITTLSFLSALVAVGRRRERSVACFLINVSTRRGLGLGHHQRRPISDETPRRNPFLETNKGSALASA